MRPPIVKHYLVIFIVALFLVICPLVATDDTETSQKSNNVSLDYTAIQSLKENAQKGDPLAISELGRYYYDKGNFTEALQWNTKGYENRDGDSGYRLAMLLLAEKNPAYNPEKAFEILMNVADASASASLQLGKMYRDGIGTSKDETEAIKWLVKASEAGSTQAQSELFRLYQTLNAQKGGYEKELGEYAAKASSNGDVEAVIFLIESARQNQADKSLWDKLVTDLEKNAKSGDSRLKLELAMLYVEGRSTSDNEAKGRKTIQELSSDGNAVACYYQGIITQREVMSRAGEKKAFSYFDEAARQDYPPAIFSLAVCYQEGLGVDRDATIAFDQMKKAAYMGYPPACRALADMYHKGIGVSKNAREAYKWLCVYDSKVKDPIVTSQMDELKASLTPAEITAIKTAAKAFEPEKPGSDQSAQEKNGDAPAEKSALGKGSNDQNNEFDSVKIQSSLVFVEAGTSRGSGFLCQIDGKNYIVTNIHVIETADEVKFKDLVGKEIAFGKYKVADDRDIIIYELTGEYSGYIPEPLFEQPAIGEPINVYGNSEGAGVATKISGKTLAVGPDRIEVDAAFVQGNSDSPIFNRKGKVMGVASFVTVNQNTDNWVSKGTRFEGVRRYGLRIESGMNWVEVSGADLKRQALLFRDYQTYFEDFFNFMIFWYDPKKRDNAADFIEQYTPAFNAKRYSNPKLPEKLEALAQEYRKCWAAINVRTGSNGQKIYYFKNKSQLDWFIKSRNNILKSIHQSAKAQLEKEPWVNTYYRKRADEVLKELVSLESVTDKVIKDLNEF